MNDPVDLERLQAFADQSHVRQILSARMEKTRKRQDTEQGSSREEDSWCGQGGFVDVSARDDTVTTWHNGAPCAEATLYEEQESCSGRLI